MSHHTQTVSDESFAQDVLNASGLVLVDFWAEWCGPCRMIAPALDEIAKDFTGRLIVAKINIDENPLTPSRYGVRSIPTLMLVKNGIILETKAGALPKSQLRAWIESHL
ncbi:MAG: thioredoxin TrxA [Acetobacter sp.]|nr:thioredoxin TrxA [Acetobacter sp.]